MLFFGMVEPHRLLCGFVPLACLKWHSRQELFLPAIGLLLQQPNGFEQLLQVFAKVGQLPFAVISVNCCRFVYEGSNHPLLQDAAGFCSGVGMANGSHGQCRKLFWCIEVLE